MIEVQAGPSTLAQVLAASAPGTTIRLQAGSYGQLRIAGLRASPEYPIVIDGDGAATFDFGVRLEDFKPRAAEVARATMIAGKYPGVYPIANEAVLTIDGCTGIVLRNIAFRNAWPTAVYISNSADLVLDTLDFVGSTYAFYAVGAATRGLRLTSCTWTQDETLWRDVYWADVHEKLNPSVPENYTGARAYDGSFFNAVGIAGDVEVGHCTVKHAFNGVHLFNGAQDLALSRNVHVHDCHFELIKDNPIEPEDTSCNWWVHDNTFLNCHKWFSMELVHAGWIYIFRNRGWFTDKPGPADEENNGGSVLKLRKKVEEIGDYPGPLHIFNNSWFLRSSIAKEGALRHLWHHNNAIAYCNPQIFQPPGICDNPGVFGSTIDSSKQFTRDWLAWDIHFVNDCVWHNRWPPTGFDVRQPVNQDPRFLWEEQNRFELPVGANPCRGGGYAMPVRLPDGSIWTPHGDFNIGWAQDRPDVFAGLTYRRLTEI